MKQQITICLELIFEDKDELCTHSIDDKYSKTIIAGCQIFAEKLTAPVTILDITTKFIK